MLEITDIIGIIAFAISGFVIGVKHKLDLFGVLISTFLTSLGGGILRDVVANNTIYSFTNIIPGIIVFCVFLIGIVFKLYKFNFNNRFFLIFDSIGLVSFSISGSIVAINSGFNIFGVIFLSFITAIGGGMLRDILINQVPFLLKEEFYGSVSILIAILLFIFGIDDIVIVFIFILGLIVRLVAYIKNWKLPII